MTKPRLSRAHVYVANDGDGYCDLMDEYSDKGEYYYADDVDKEIERLRAAVEALRPKPTVPDIATDSLDVGYEHAIDDVLELLGSHVEPSGQ